jgi:membrane-associated phospholipid phosphatase
MRDLRHYQRVWVPALRWAFLVAGSVAMSASSPSSLGAQAPADLRTPSLVTWKDARLVGAFTLAAVATMPADRDGQRLMQRRWVQGSPAFSHTADVFNAYGSPGVLAGSAALYAVGWASGRADVARAGMRAGEAIVLSGIVTGGIKGVGGRARPYASPGDPGDVRLMSGVRDETRQSFPSGHATAAFAFAAAVDQELRSTHPRMARWAGPALYGAAALTGLARMHADKHWASDVVMGAGIGVVSGRVISRFHANRPGHWLDRRLLPRPRE